MSTAQDIFDLLAYRRDIQLAETSMYPVLNAAVRAIANRLYVLDSDLITDVMEIPIYAEVSYTASMAFVDSNPDTITDAAVQFVAEGFAANMPITTNSATNPGPFRINTVTVGTLTLVSTDSVTAAGAASLAITSDDAYAYLPSDFWGLKSKFEPYLDGYSQALVPLPSQDVAMEYTDSGFPLYYKIRDKKIYLYPHAGSDYTIIGDYYKRPTKLTTSTDTMPWNELFDTAISEAMVKFLRSPAEGSGNSMMIMDKLLKDEVDRIALKYDRKGAPTFKQAIPW